MQNIKRFNKGISILVATTLMLGGTSKVVIAATESKVEATSITSNKIGAKVNGKESKGQKVNVTTLPKVETTELGKFYGDYDKYRISFPSTTDKEFEEFEKYIKAINDTNKVTVNGVKYDNSGLVNEKDNYHFGTLGLDINPSAFTEDINTIIVKADGYNDMKIKIKKDGTFVSEEEIKSEDVDNTKPQEEVKLELPKIEKVEYGKFYSDLMKYRINFLSKTDDDWNCVDKYRTVVNKANKVTVNGIQYNSGDVTKENSYSFGLIGFELNPSAFKDGSNTIVIKADGYEDMTIKVKKDGEKVSLDKAASDDGSISKPEKPTNSADTDKQTEEWKSVTTLPKIANTRYGEIYGRVEYEISFEQNDKLQKYVNACSSYNEKTKPAEVTVNGVRYEQNFNFGINQYHLSYMGGLELNDKAFKEDINTIIVKVDGYNDMRIKIKKDGTLISQEESTVGTSIKENIQINIMKDIAVTAGEPINLKSGVLAYVIGKEKIDLTDEVKVNPGKLDVKNPKEGTYEVTYSVTYNGQTESKTRKVTVTQGNVSTDNLTDGIYTIGFKAYRADIPENESMLGGFFDEKAKVEVKDGKVTLTMLNTLLASSLLDFRMESNGEYPETKATYKGEPDSQGNYQMKTFEIPISDLNSDHLACVLVSDMGGRKSQIGNFDKYKKVRFVFDKNCIKGWDGFNKDKEAIDASAEFNKALIDAGLDKDGDGIVTDEEIGKATGAVKLSSKKIKDISRLRHLGSGVTELYLNGNNISYLPKGVFDGLTGLEKLSLSTNRIVELPEGIFDNLKDLTDLSLSKNYIIKLQKGTFDKLKNLKSLGLSENQLNELPDGIFNKLTALEGLYLYDNKIESIPTGIGKLKQLKNLSINANKIEKVPEELSELSNLTNLHLNNNFIKEIPDKVYKNLRNLSTFEIYDNELTYVPENIKELLPNVRQFNFRLNRLNRKPNITNLSKKGFYPQKNTFNLQLTAKDGKLTWKQDLSALDMYLWETYMDNCSSVDEYNKKLNGKTPEEYLREKSNDWRIVTEIQKKEPNGKYITIEDAVNENEKDVTKGTYNDPDMKEGNEYRIIKSVISAGGFERLIFSDIANAVAKKGENTKPEQKPEDKKEFKNGVYSLNAKILKENSDDPSMAAQYIKDINCEIENGNKYITVSLNRIDWMKDLKVTVDGKEITPQITDRIKNKNGEEQGKIRFQIGSLNSKIMLHMNVVPMGNSTVAFRLVPDKNTLTLIKESTNLQEDLNKDTNKEENKDTNKEVSKEANKDTTQNVIKEINNETSKETNQDMIQNKNKEINNETSNKINKKISKEDKKETIKKKTALPKTGMPFNTGALATLGTIITALGFALRKYRK
ncbi:NEAT domain-containing protein [Hathewaya massiliensis]|uniref:NEAT domain-containing protein n=1 Tax=Hathewaya massiliensis TaxID=1964382 RepID=UPI00115AA308|nr:NEAT domain-containing protein [Hathewaya massiliensis]